MYQGKILREIQQLNNEKFILFYEDNTQEQVLFDSFNISVGNRKYSINKMFQNMKHKIPLKIQNSTFYSSNFNNLSLKKMTLSSTLNNQGFKQTLYKYLFLNNIDDFAISFNLKNNNQEVKIILILTKERAIFLPIVFINKKFNIDTINFSKTYQYLKSHFCSQNKDIDNKKFKKLIEYSDYLHQNSTIFYY